MISDQITDPNTLETIRWIIFILSVVSVISAFLCFALEKNEANTKRIIAWALTSAFLGIISATFTFWHTRVQDRIDDRKQLMVVSKIDTTKQNTFDIKTEQLKSIDSLNKVLSLQNDLLKKEIKQLEIGNSLLGYATGGSDNKPIVLVNFTKLSDGNFQTTFSIWNPGQYPISFVNYEIEDRPSLTYDFFKLYPTAAPPEQVTERINLMNEYNYVHKKESLKQGEITNLPTSMIKPIASGFFNPRMPIADYVIRIWWNNQYYLLNYSYITSKDKNSIILYAFRVIDHYGKPVKDLSKFFPTVPKSIWKGFNVKTGLANEDSNYFRLVK